MTAFIHVILDATTNHADFIVRKAKKIVMRGSRMSDLKRVKESGCPYTNIQCQECKWNYADTCNFDVDSYEQGRADYGNEILNYATELKIENGCIDHTENECGEWVTMTIDYSKWAELWWFIEKHKKLEEQSNE